MERDRTEIQVTGMERDGTEILVTGTERNGVERDVLVESYVWNYL